MCKYILKTSNVLFEQDVEPQDCFKGNPCRMWSTNQAGRSRMVTQSSTTTAIVSIKVCNSTQRSSHEMKGTQHSNSTDRIPGTESPENNQQLASGNSWGWVLSRLHPPNQQTPTTSTDQYPEDSGQTPQLPEHHAGSSTSIQWLPHPSVIPSPICTAEECGLSEAVRGKETTLDYWRFPHRERRVCSSDAYFGEVQSCLSEVLR